MGGKDTETCGRCSMTAAVGAVETDDDGTDPFEGDRIEIEESKVRTVARPAVWLGRARRWLDDLVTRLTYGR